MVESNVVYLNDSQDVLVEALENALDDARSGNCIAGIMIFQRPDGGLAFYRAGEMSSCESAMKFLGCLDYQKTHVMSVLENMMDKDESDDEEYEPDPEGRKTSEPAEDAEPS